MADADSTLTVDGVEPSIPVKLLKIQDNPAKVKIFNDDNGGERWLDKDDEGPTLCTPSDLGALGAFGIEIVKDDDSEPVVVEKNEVKDVAPITTQNAPESGVVKLSPAIPTGQSSPQV
jgi:hypothetical protein